MASPNRIPLTPQTSSKRRYLKCRECRRKKCKCEPEDRAWNSEEHIRCRRCEAGGQDCGPNLRSLRQSRDLQSPSILELTPPSTTSSTAKFHNPFDQTAQTEIGASDESFAVYTGGLSVKPAGAGAGPESDGSASLGRRRSTLRQRLIQLGNCRDLVEQTQTRSLASRDVEATASILPPPHGSGPERQTLQGVRGTIDHALHSACTQFSLIFRNALDLVEEFAEACEERFGYISRLSTHLETFIELLRRCGMFHDGEDSSWNRLRRSVLKELITFYTREGDTPEADRLKRLLRGLPCLLGSTTPADLEPCQEADEFANISCRIQAALRELNLNTQYTQYLPEASASLFPPIHTALHSNRSTTALLMSSTSQFNPGDVDILGRQVLHLAAESSNLHMLESIAQRRPELLEGRDIYHMTPLSIAALYGHSDFFQRLVEAGANMRARDGLGRSVLCIASGAGHLQIVTYILDKGVGPNDDKLHVCSPLHAAVAGGYEAVVKALLHYGAKVDWLSNWQTPLEIATMRGLSSIIYLLEEANTVQDSQKSHEMESGDGRNASPEASYQSRSFVDFSPAIFGNTKAVAPQATRIFESRPSTSVSLSLQSNVEAVTPSPQLSVSQSWTSMLSETSP